MANFTYSYVKHWNEKLQGFYKNLREIDFVDYKNWITNWLLKNADEQKLKTGIKSYTYLQYAHYHFIRAYKKNLLVSSKLSYLENMTEVEDEALLYQNDGAALEAELVALKLKRFLTDEEYKLINEIMSTTESVYTIIKRYNISSTKYLKFMDRVRKILGVKNGES